MLALPAEFEQFHWMVDMVQNVDMGLIVINRGYNVQVWNGFMTHHSGKQAHDVIGKSLFEIFPEIPVEWFKLKPNLCTIWVAVVLLLGSSALICSIAVMCAQ